MSNSLQKYIRRSDKKIILATCHYDILEWLQPDWVYDLNKGGVLERGDYLRQRPQIQLQMYRTTYDTWHLFKKHHYMTQDMNTSASCYCFTWENMLVGFCSVLANPGKGLDGAWRICRLVVLPDFQGLGIGSKIADFIGSVYRSLDYNMYIKTVNPSLGCYFENSESWSPTSFNGKARGISETDKKRYPNRLERASYCYKYIGQPTYGCEDLLKPIDKLRYEKSMEGQLCLF